METPAGMVYIDTRRHGDKVWVRVADFIPPNIHQFPPNAAPMARQTTVNRPTATRWAVPIDDTHTMQIGFNRAPAGREPRRNTGFGQDDNRPYEARQRVPGDYDAQTSIHGGISRHGLEHLAATDRGITMLRNLLRRGDSGGPKRRGPGPRSRSGWTGRPHLLPGQGRVRDSPGPDSRGGLAAPAGDRAASGHRRTVD